MSHQDDPGNLSDADPAQTDEEALALLPPFAAARQTYRAARSEGYSPQEALRETLKLWRQFQACGRPAGYGKPR